MADDNHQMSPFSLLPEDCISNIISLTSPKDACRAAAVSLGFKSAAESDAVWELFLPPDYQEIVSGSSSPVGCSSKKELYFRLCDSALLLNGDKLSFRLSRSTGKKCLMLSARELQIAWKDTPTYWMWTSSPDSRFAEVAELLSVCWLDIGGIFPSQMLSPNTNYSAYLVYKLSDDHYGLEYSSMASVKLVKESTTESEGETTAVYLSPERNVGGRVPRSRTDGWLEIELGEFFIGERDQCDIQIKLFETEQLDWKRGLIVEGIEVRPKEDALASLEIGVQINTLFGL